MIAAGKWRLAGGNGGNRYVMTKTGILLHRLITRAPLDKKVDHRNGDTLNCQRENLRICTQSQNAQNQSVINPHNKSSGYKNVHWSKHLKLWIVKFKKKGTKGICKASRSLEKAKMMADQIRREFHPFHERD